MEDMTTLVVRMTVDGDMLEFDFPVSRDEMSHMTFGEIKQQIAADCNISDHTTIVFKFDIPNAEDIDDGLVPDDLGLQDGSLIIGSISIKPTNALHTTQHIGGNAPHSANPLPPPEMPDSDGLNDGDKLGAVFNNSPIDRPKRPSPFIPPAPNTTDPVVVAHQMSWLSELEQQLLWRIIFRRAFALAVHESSKNNVDTSGGGSSSFIRKRANDNPTSPTRSGVGASGTATSTGAKEACLSVPIAAFRTALKSTPSFMRVFSTEATALMVADKLTNIISDDQIKLELSWEDITDWLTSLGANISAQVKPDMDILEGLIPHPVSKRVTIASPSTGKKVQFVLSAGVDATEVSKRIIETEDFGLSALEADKICRQVRKELVSVYQEELRLHRVSWVVIRDLISDAEDLMEVYESTGALYAEQTRRAEIACKAAVDKNMSSEGSFSIGRGVSGTVLAKLGKQILDTKLRVTGLDERIANLTIEKQTRDANRAASATISPPATPLVEDEDDGQLSRKGTMSNFNMDNEFGAADANNDGIITREEWAQWAADKKRMMKESETNRKVLVSENRKLRNLLEINPNSIKLERRFHAWDDDKSSMNSEILGLEARKRDLEAGIKMSVDMADDMMNDEDGDDGNGDGNDAIMSRFLMSLSKEQLMKKWASEVQDLSNAKAARKRTWDKEKAGLEDKIETFKITIARGAV